MTNEAKNRSDEVIDLLRKIEQNTRHGNRQATKRFTPPTFVEVGDYVHKISAQIDVLQFMNFYESKGWMIGKNKMKDWKAAVRTWKKRETKAAKTKLYPISGKTCSERSCRLPAVYKDTSGTYDYYYCADHMPDKVKELYE